MTDLNQGTLKDFNNLGTPKPRGKHFKVVCDMGKHESGAEFRMKSDAEKEMQRLNDAAEACKTCGCTTWIVVR